MHPSRLRNLLLLIAALTASVALVACGGDDETTSESTTEASTTETGTTESTDTSTTETSTTGSAETPPDEVTKEFLLAIANGDGEAACGVASENALKSIEASGPCEQQVTEALGSINEKDRADVEKATFETTEEDESSATVTATKPDGTEETFSLVLEDGEWKIDG